ncbi:hypothetical protein EON65_22035 [archaeon]|nr:MAG: hypothetical protein EON65_22035 [archaeon]
MKYVQVRLVDETGGVTEGDGELQVKGPCVFKEYLNNPIATSQTFDQDGWFKTGDIAWRDSDGYHMIKGRASTDIIKSAGYKVSALEIERELLSCNEVDEVAVVGQIDEVKGEKIVAVVKASAPLDEKMLNKWLEDKLAHYKRPKEYIFVKEIPRNALGKVNKKTLLKELKNND